MLRMLGAVSPWVPFLIFDAIGTAIGLGILAMRDGVRTVPCRSCHRFIGTRQATCPHCGADTRE